MILKIDFLKGSPHIFWTTEQTFDVWFLKQIKQYHMLFLFDAKCSKITNIMTYFDI